MSEKTPPCDCAERVEGVWTFRCYCSNRDDGERMAMWCAETKAADTITALRAEVERLKGDLEAADIAMSRLNGGAEIQDLLKLNNSLVDEVERLRAALAAIHNNINTEGSPYDVALKALEELMLSIKRQTRATLNTQEPSNDRT